MIRIPLTQGQEAFVSDEDAELAQVKWQAVWHSRYSGGGKFLAQRTVFIDGKSRTEMLHRAVCSRVLGRPLLRSEWVDHIHGLTLDNRRSELRLASPSQNAANRGKNANNKSGFKGVYYSRSMRKWKASITKSGKQKSLGYFDAPEDAYAAYCNADAELNGEFAHIDNSQMQIAKTNEGRITNSLYSNNTSGYRGVSWSARHRKWRAQIRIKCRYKHLGLFDTPEAAYEAYCIAKDSAK